MEKDKQNIFVGLGKQTTWPQRKYRNLSSTKTCIREKTLQVLLITYV